MAIIILVNFALLVALAPVYIWKRRSNSYDSKVAWAICLSALVLINVIELIAKIQSGAPTWGAWIPAVGYLTITITSIVEVIGKKH